MNTQPSIIRKLLDQDPKWCKAMGYTNPYLSAFKNHIYDYVVVSDGPAYDKYQDLRHVYDKLWVARTQNMKCGELEELEGKEEDIKYPIFIKPRYGHLSAASKNCFKIKNADELKKYRGYKDMMWSDYLDGREGMTDFIVHGGNEVYQLTYLYSKDQHGFADAWKLISPHTECPPAIRDWLREHIRGHTGFVNIQYRAGKIIEVSLRPARGGAYIIATDNKALIDNINDLYKYGRWDHSKAQAMQFKPYYAFKCHCRVPVMHVWPATFKKLLMKMLTPHPLFEYYFEPVGSDGVIFMQFMHPDFEAGKRAKELIEVLFFLTQAVAMILYTLAAYVLFQPRSTARTVILVAATLFFASRFLNPLFVNYDLYKAYRQQILGSDSLMTEADRNKAV